MIGLDLKSKRMIVGIALAFLSLLACGLTYSWLTGALFALVFLAEGALVLRPKNQLITVLLHLAWGLCSLAAICVINPLIGFYEGSIPRLLLNYLLVLAVTGACFLITARWRTSVNISLCLLSLLLVANALLYQFRGKELTATDLLSIGTALSVADQYTVELTKGLLYFALTFFASLFFQSLLPPCPVPEKKGRWISRLVALVSTVAIALTVGIASSNIDTITWNYKGSRLNGFFLNFYLGIRDAFVQRPEGYSPERVSQYAASAKPDEETVRRETPPNIIIIMDEAFADLRVFPKELKTNVPVTPFIDSLTENTVRGFALSSVMGGNTANSEFELLTGHSMAFLPNGSVPYQQYLTEPVSSLAWLLESYGYHSFATHPYLSSGWSRTTAFPLLGMENYSFIEDYPCQDLVREFVSDREMFEYVLDRLDQTPDGSPLFLFGITMQNHSGYEYQGENYTQTIYLEGYDRDYPRTEQYLSLLHETDKAVEYLITSLEDHPEDTIVLFFGDHMPGIEQGFYRKLNGGELDTLDEQMLQYTVPFFLWANYDIEEEVIGCTSINYLSGHLLKHAGLELSPYHTLLSQIEAVIPAINANGYYSNEAQCFLPFDQAKGKEAEMLEMYSILQYNDLFDPEHRNWELFGQYLPQ